MANPFAAAAQDLSRQRSRARSSSIFAGAETGRLMSDWLVGTFSTDDEVSANLRLLRARARQLVRDNPWIAGFVDELANNVIGPDGILLQAKVMTTARPGAPATLASATNKEIERGWKEWGMPETCSADGHDSWVELQRLAVQTVAVEGECFLRRLRGFDNAFGYSVQIIDADLVDETYNVPVGAGQNQIRMGVEIDKWNRPIAYHVWTRYPMDRSGVERKRERIAADEIIHLFVRYRANQTRGVTWFAPILTSVHHLDGYEINELVATRAAAAKMGFIINKHPEAISNFDPGKPGDKRRQMDAEPGLIDELFPGQEFVSFDPSHPAGAYEMFTSTVLRAIARGLKVSYLTLTGDLRAANYSSMRAGLLPERDRWRGLQVWFGVHCCRIVYRDWIRMALLAGAVVVDTRLASEYYEVVWKGRGWKWVDPEKDLIAAEKEVKLGVNSRQRIAAERGVDYEEVIEEIEYEETFADDHDVDVSGTIARGSAPAAAAPKTPDPLRPDEPGDAKDANAGERSPQLAVV